MEPDLQNKLEAIDKKLDAIYKSTERTRKYMLWTFILGIVVVVLPLLGLIVVIPSYLSQLSSVTSLGL